MPWPLVSVCGFTGSSARTCIEKLLGWRVVSVITPDYVVEICLSWSSQRLLPGPILPEGEPFPELY
jgi:hypothetical protein